MEEGNIFLEVGAYIGFYVMRTAEIVGVTGKVVAIEAIPENFQLLKKNIEDNSLNNVYIVQKAAWNSKSIISFQRNSRQMASAIPNIVDPREKLTVDAETVDSILKDLNIPAVDCVRIQVNGAEQETLDGMNRLLELSPKLNIAAKYEKNSEPSWKKVVVFLEGKGYTIQRNRGNIFAEKKTLDP